MTIRKESEAWFLREHGDGNFSRTESGEYADLAVRNYWGIWKGAWAALGEQSPGVPEGFRIFRSPHEGDTDIHLAMKLGDEGYLMSSWLSEGGRDDDDTVGRLAYRLADALLSAQPTKQRPAPAVQGEPVEFDYPDFHEQGMGCGLEDRNITDRYEAMRYGWDKALERVAENIGSLGPLYTFPQPTEQQPAPDVAGLIICDECHAKCSEPYTGLFASHCPDEEPCIMCECSSLRRRLASRSGVQVEPDVAGLVTLLEHARCNTCDGSGALYDGHGQVGQCQWCHERSEALAAHRKQGGEA